MLPQLLPQAPQLVKFAASSTHVFPHIVKPGLHVHWPPLQNRPPLHVVPHAPQSSELSWRSAQIWLFGQFSPPGHAQSWPAHMHCPFTHVSPAEQWLLQAPHATGSFIVSTQTPLQFCLGAGHVHWPATQLSPGAHWLLHAPQWLTLLDRSTQPWKPPQNVWPTTGQAH